jgi:hypothetical protein
LTHNPIADGFLTITPSMLLLCVVALAGDPRFDQEHA